ncbi:hypothetical protein COU20_03965 [Candidatus Kaiserbacteria bacterium CG10_big_fil_rev_8_21_14_0_10_59_10]|uniref:Uncharacterized protein n=1 Tax=Candidatus Kaiserbacteria bacterium CG10_big_fil_rev_8_21_14_0_10_59_10 TaxID=1974612 RepID=A0A2H0U6V8_9BACT|nr:MAG: hypothetical protein COU20_03965 [Candidatus Kaiserbacteria bacterium CG10_big_fil_rev_8_21_14_0_10_59_10]
MGFFLLSGISSPKVQHIAPGAEVAPQREALQTHTVLLTGYNAVPEQTNDDPFTTASGAYSNPEIVIARSRDMADELPYGTVVEIAAREGTPSGSCGIEVVEHLIGLRVVADTMHPRKKNQMDIMFPVDTKVSIRGKEVNPAVALGICRDVEVRVVGKVDIRGIPRTQTELAAALNRASLAARN